MAALRGIIITIRMRQLYNLSIRLFTLVLMIAWPFSAKARKWIRGRRKVLARLQAQIVGDEPIIWFHCASLGEFEQGRPLIEAIHDQYPGHKILLTFFSPSGYEVRKHYGLADYVSYLPADTPRNARRFIEIVNPDLVIFVKYEFWLNYLRVIGERNIPLLLVSGIFRPGHRFFRWYGAIFREGLRAFHHLFVQDEDSLKLLADIGVQNVTVSGDTRFDRVDAIARNPLPLTEISAFCGENKIVIGGSLWPPDEDVIHGYIKSRPDRVRFILAPHEVSPGHTGHLLKKYQGRAVSLSRWLQKPEGDFDILVIDSIGILSSVYQFGHVAFIGGGYGKGIHNILEAAVFGLPVFFGPNYKKFREARALIELGGAFAVAKKEDFAENVVRLVEDDDYRDTVSRICRDYVQERCGATTTILGKISGYIS